MSAVAWAKNKRKYVAASSLQSRNINILLQIRVICITRTLLLIVYKGLLQFARIRTVVRQTNIMREPYSITELEFRSNSSINLNE